MSIKGVIFGEYGIGKTSLLQTLPEDTTLAIDLEAGMLSVAGWGGRIEVVRSWRDAKRLAALIGGVDPSAEAGKEYSAEHYALAAQAYPTIDMTKIETVFIDSITVASRLCMKWVKQQPEAHDKQGQYSNLKAYGLLGQEMMRWLSHLQHTPNKNIWFVGLLNKQTGDEGSISWEPQMEGSKAGMELPGLVDEVLTMAEIKVKRGEEETTRRGLVCQKINPWHYPAKDRSGVLNVIEPPHLGNLMDKINTEKRSVFNVDTSEFLDDEIIF